MDDPLVEMVEQEFPPVRFAMAYGSVPFEQKCHDNSNSMIDFVFAVDNPMEWHQANIEQSPHHYSSLRHLGAHNICKIQQGFGAKMYYNTLVPVPTQYGLKHSLMKYGVLSTDEMHRELTEWNNLYLSGRMHKPVRILKSCENLDQAIEANYLSAVHTSLLFLPNHFEDTELFLKIAGLSYAGDFRMAFGENPEKVRNIVEGNKPQFRSLYHRVIEKSPFMGSSGKQSFLCADTSVKARSRLLCSLPSGLSTKIFGSNPPAMEDSSVLKIAQDYRNKKVSRALASIVSKSSRTQSLKGILTAGCIKSSIYVFQKLRKTYGK